MGKREKSPGPVDKAQSHEIPGHQEWKENPNGFSERKNTSDTKDQNQKMLSDFSAAVLEAKKEGSHAFRFLKKAIVTWNFKPSIPKLKCEGKKKIFFPYSRAKNIISHAFLIRKYIVHSFMIIYGSTPDKRGAWSTRNTNPSQKKDVGKPWTLA